jgi:hypothetical protein
MGDEASHEDKPATYVEVPKLTNESIASSAVERWPVRTTSE